MNAEVKAQWLDALRSGDYQQTKGRLRRDKPIDAEDAADGYGEGYCCLGVLCDLAVKAGVTKLHEEHPWEDHPNEDARRVIFYSYGVGEVGDSSVLPADVSEWAGFEGPDASNPYVDGLPPTEEVDENGFYVQRKSLASENDNGKSFEDIAKIIEEKF